jgi:pimeloyl-ACP methyl ester carboxylesterase
MIMKQICCFLFAVLGVSVAISQPVSVATAHPMSSPTADSVTLTIAGGNLYGTLLLPAAESGKTGKVPVVLIIAGSGPTDRDGNSSMGIHTDMYKLLADSLAQHGIASLRYDKRGIGASKAAMKSEADVRFGDGISDAGGWLAMLRVDPRFSSVIVFGHSEGSLIGMVAAGLGHADGYISAAGAGDRIDRIIERQMAAQSGPLAARATVIFDSLVSGDTVKCPPDLMVFFRPSVQPYLISWLQYDPQAEIHKLHIPVLIIQGSTDLQATVGDAELLKKAKPDASLLVIAQMNHIFRQAGDDRKQNLATYTQPGLPLDPQLVQAVTAFVQNIRP